MAPLTITLPEPCLVVLVGPSGSGKSTFARRHFAADEIVSSDELRAAIAGDATDQSRNRAVFDAVHRAVDRRLTAGRRCVVDATNVEHHARRGLLRLASRRGVPAVAIVFDLPLETLLAQDGLRPGRTVPREVIERHHRTLGRVLADGNIEGEGFAMIYLLTTVADVEAIDVKSTGGG